MEEVPDNPVNIANDLERKIADAFEIFDHHLNGTVDVREIGSIIRYLGCVPDENELNEIISSTESEDSSGVVHLSKFMPYFLQILLENRMKPAAPEKLLKAFQMLDPDNKGCLSREFMTKIMMEEGEPFTQEENDEMMAVAVNPATNSIQYELFINQLMID